MASGSWTWLEVAKLIASLLTPNIVLFGGIYIHRITKRFEHNQWRSQKLVEKRLAIYDDIAPIMNDVLTLHICGGWRDRVPSSVVALKRELDKRVHLAAPLFSIGFFPAYTEIQRLCFKPYGCWGKDAKLRTGYKRREECWIGKWDPEWNDFFSDDGADQKDRNQKDIKSAYEKVMTHFAEDVGVHSSYVIPHSSRHQIPS